MSSSFVNMVFSSAVTTPLYYYSLIPFFMLIALISVNFKELVAAFDYYGLHPLHGRQKRAHLERIFLPFLMSFLFLSLR